VSDIDPMGYVGLGLVIVAPLLSFLVTLKYVGSEGALRADRLRCGLPLRQDATWFARRVYGEEAVDESPGGLWWAIIEMGHGVGWDTIIDWVEARLPQEMLVCALGAGLNRQEVWDHIDATARTPGAASTGATSASAVLWASRTQPGCVLDAELGAWVVAWGLREDAPVHPSQVRGLGVPMRLI
jgi:hypothetical protein